MSWQDWILFVLLLLSSGMVLAGQKLMAMPQFQKSQLQLKLAQGVLGLLTLAWGLYCLVVFLTSRYGFFTIVFVLSLLLAIALGLLLGYRLIRKQAAATGAAETGDRVEAKLSRNQVALGVAGLVAVVLLLLFEISGPSAVSGTMPMPVPTPRTTPMPLPTPVPLPIPTPTP